MMRPLQTAGAGQTRTIITSAGLLTALVLAASGCTSGASAVAGSTYSSGSVYRSATAYVQIAPDQAFNPAVKMLLERGDIEITDLKEADNRCKAVTGDHKITFRVIESGAGRSRLSMLVGGGRDPVSNQELADDLLQTICRRLSAACE